MLILGPKMLGPIPVALRAHRQRVLDEHPRRAEWNAQAGTLRQLSRQRVDLGGEI